MVHGHIYKYRRDKTGLAPHIEDRVVFSNSVVNFLNNDANDCYALKDYVEIALRDGKVFGLLNCFSGLGKQSTIPNHATDTIVTGRNG